MTGAPQADGLSQAEPVSRLGPSGFDPSRGGLFRKRPIEVQAFQWVGQDRNDWPEWAAEVDHLEDICAVLIGCAAVGLKVWTTEGAIRASHGDWIIQGVRGELYPCKPDVFAETYDAIAMEARQGGDGETRLHPKDDSAGPQDIAQ